MTAEFSHLPVMAMEVLDILNPRPGGRYLDGTIGGAGHAGLILEKSCPDGFLIGVDRDKEALEASKQRLSAFEGRFMLVHGAFWDVVAELSAGGKFFDGFILDLGVSSHQIDRAERGFSFRLDGPLDMRMNREEGYTAAEIVNNAPETEIARIIRDYGEERWWRKIAATIVRERKKSPIETTMSLAEIVKGAIPARFREERIHPATRTFQALRIAVNGELDNLASAISDFFDMLTPGGRGAVISFHSLEDRIVKNTFRELASGCECPRNFPVCVCKRTPKARILTSKPIVAGENEICGNPRARSAKLRGIEKL